MNIPLCQPSITDTERSAIIEALNSGWLTEGPKNEEFEKMFAKFIGVKHAISVNSCASALFMAIKSLNITGGEVILPSFTFAATANAIVTAGAIPVFADVQDTLNIDVDDIEYKITDKTQAIIVVHTAGQVCDMSKIMALAKKHNLYVIEDSAQTIGGTWQNKQAGSFGDLGCFSFFPTKNMTTGEGGMITTNNDDLAKKIRILIAHGVEKKNDAQGNLVRAVVEPGFNFRMSNILAALGLEQFKRLKNMNSRRIRRAEYLNKKITNPKIIKPTIDMFAKSVYQMYIIQIKENRDEIIKHLKNAGIAATIYCNPPVHLQPYYTENFPADKTTLINTLKFSQQNIILPMYPDMTKEQTDYIIEVLNKI